MGPVECTVGPVERTVGPVERTVGPLRQVERNLDLGRHPKQRRRWAFAGKLVVVEWDQWTLRKPCSRARWTKSSRCRKLE